MQKAETLEQIGYHLMVGPYQKKVEAGNVEVVDTETPTKKLDKPSLGELNPLIHRPDLTSKEAVDALQYVSLEKIAKYGGMPPSKMAAEHVVSRNPNGGSALRFIARFEVPPEDFTTEKMELLEELVKNSYRTKARTRKTTDGKKVPLEVYPPTSKNDTTNTILRGWYMGPDQSATDSLHQGLFVFKDLGEVNETNFFENEEIVKNYIVEVRDASKHQTDLVELITQVSSILGQGKVLDHGELLYEIYNDLMRLGLRDFNEDLMFGMKDAIEKIYSGLLIPLASPQLSQGVDQKPESVMMVGYPGTGKTLVAEKILHDETGIFILPLDPIELAKELREDKEKQEILPRIAQVSRSTGKPVVLHIDDIENMLQDDDVTHSTMLNLMRGIRETGFHIIASTNEPEKIGEALLQPQRFGNIIYFDLQDKDARREILKLHTLAKSKELGIPLFPSDEVREGMLEVLADKTDKYTPRYLARLVNVAMSRLVTRIATAKGSTIGLTEKDLEGYISLPEDWEFAHADTEEGYDREAVEKRVAFLKEFVHKLDKKPKIGLAFPKNGSKNGKLFPQDIYDLYIRAESLEQL
jgi:hypothetical protein